MNLEPLSSPGWQASSGSLPVLPPDIALFDGGFVSFLEQSSDFETQDTGLPKPEEPEPEKDLGPAPAAIGLAPVWVPPKEPLETTIGTPWTSIRFHPDPEEGASSPFPSNEAAAKPEENRAGTAAPFASDEVSPEPAENRAAASLQLPSAPVPFRNNDVPVIPQMQNRSLDASAGTSREEGQPSLPESDAPVRGSQPVPRHRIHWPDGLEGAPGKKEFQIPARRTEPAFHLQLRPIHTNPDQASEESPPQWSPGKRALPPAVRLEARLPPYSPPQRPAEPDSAFESALPEPGRRADDGPAVPAFPSARPLSVKPAAIGGPALPPESPDSQLWSRAAAASIPSASVAASENVPHSAGEPVRFPPLIPDTVPEWMPRQGAAVEVTDFRLRLDGSVAPRVEIRVKDAAPGTEVSVHTSDPLYNQALRERLAELVTGIEGAGFSVDPSASTTDAKPRPQIANDRSPGGGSENPGDPPRKHPDTHAGNGHPQRNRRHDGRAWRRDLETAFSTVNPVTAGYGRR